MIPKERNVMPRVTKAEIEGAKKLLTDNGFVVVEKARVHTAIAECRLALPHDDTPIIAEHTRQILADRLGATVLTSKAASESTEIEGEHGLNPCRKMRLELVVIMPEAKP